jgi:glycosyltransferase involved in cell wall biosynthesis
MGNYCAHKSGAAGRKKNRNSLGMRILLSSNHQYPAYGERGSGPHPRELPSGSGHHIKDLLAKGLSELGHEVFYLLKKGAAAPLPPGVTLLAEPIADVDIYHNFAFRDEDIIAYMEKNGRPWVTTCHLDLRARGKQLPATTPNWIFVSKTLAHSYNSERFVWNGIDPGDFVYSKDKDNYLMFISALDWAMDKGLETALSVAQEAGVPLVVAGTAGTYDVIHEVEGMCRATGATYVGDVRGGEKARLLARAKGVLFPTRLNEAFGLVMVEGLMSGTPVICSDRGACPEIVFPEIGFLCRGKKDYVEAIQRLENIDPEVCRARAMRDYHYLRMAAEYVREYAAEADMRKHN